MYFYTALESIATGISGSYETFAFLHLNNIVVKFIWVRFEIRDICKDSLI